MTRTTPRPDRVPPSSRPCRPTAPGRLRAAQRRRGGRGRLRRSGWSTPAVPASPGPACLDRDADRDADRHPLARLVGTPPAAEPAAAHPGHRATLGAAVVAGRHRIAFLRAADGPAQLWLLPAGGGEARAADDAAARRRRAGLEPGRHRDRVRRAGRHRRGASARRPTRRSSRTGSTTRPTAPVCCATCASTCTSSTSATGEVRQVTDGDWHAGDPAWSPDGDAAGVRGGDRARRRPDPRSRRLRRRRPPTGAGARAAPVGDGAPRPGDLDPGRRRAAGRGPAGRRRRPRRAAAGPAGRRPGASTWPPTLDRNVMPGGPGYPGGLPQLAAGGDAIAVLRPRPRLHARLRRRRRRRTGARRCSSAPAGSSSGLSVAGDAAAVVVGTPALVRRGRARRPGDRGRDDADRRTRRPDLELPVARGAGVHRLRRHRGARLAAARPRRRPRPRRCCSTSTAARTTLERRRPTACHLYHQELVAARLGGAAAQPARPATATARRSTPPRLGAGGRPTSATSWSRWTSWSPRASPTRTGWPSPGTATAAT